MYAAGFSVLGLIVGSFLNVLILRYGAKTLGGRSECLSCATQLSWYENIPVLSWLILRGRCRSCGSSISLQYPLVELMSAGAFGGIGAAPDMPLLLKLVSCAAAALLIAIAVYDLKHTIIPDAWVYAFCALALFAMVWSSIGAGFGAAVLGFFAGPLVSSPLLALWVVSRGRWMGLGDVKLALGMGWLLGLVDGMHALLLGFILGAAVGVSLIAWSTFWPRVLRAVIPLARWYGAGGGFTMKSEIAFGPFLVAATYIVWFALLYHIALPLPFFV